MAGGRDGGVGDGGVGDGGDGVGPVVSARGVVKEYRRGDVVVRALDGVDLDVEAGTFVAVVGPSGSGKSTLLHVLSALDRPTSGEVAIAGRRLSERSEDELSDLRRDEVGFVFQFFNLLPTLSAWENVALPATFGGGRLGKLRGRAVDLLERVDMGHRVDHRPAELSGGQLQRVAIARALMTSPSLIVADEPTGNLDSAAGEQVLDLLSGLVNEGTTLVMVTHSDEAAARAHRVVHLRDGRIDGDGDAGPGPAGGAVPAGVTGTGAGGGRTAAGEGTGLGAEGGDGDPGATGTAGAAGTSGAAGTPDAPGAARGDGATAPGAPLRRE